MSLNELYKKLRTYVRVYSPEMELETYPIQYWPIEKADKFKRGENPMKDFPETLIMIAQSSQASSDDARSKYFSELFDKATSVYEKTIFINRAIDYDMINRELYQKAIEYYNSLIDLEKNYSDVLKTDIERYEKAIVDLNKYYDMVCSVPILFDLNAKKRVELDTWVLNNRREFPSFIKNKFIDAVNKEKRGSQYYWDAEKGKLWPVTLFSHQKFISDFLSEETPYRGCLLYYGLGSGKTLSSINVAEGINKRVIVFLPASLRNNYITDLYKKGCTLYHKKNHWCFVDMSDYSTDENLERLKKMGFPTDNADLLKRLYVKEGPYGRPGFWCVQKDAEKSNYKAYSAEQQKSIARTVHILREYKYQFIHYNSSGNIFRELMMSHFGTDIVGGKNVSIYTEIIEPVLIKKVFDADLKYSQLSPKQKGALKEALMKQIFTKNETDNILKRITNPLEDKIIIVDEVHNLMSQIVNGSNKGTRIYQLLMRAENSRVVALSGTPIINAPFELSLLLNMLHGYNKFYTFGLKRKIDPYNRKEVDEVLAKNPQIDQYQFNDLDKTFRVTRVPKGFRRINQNEIERDLVSPSTEDWLSSISNNLKTAGAGLYDVIRNKTEYFSIFPDIFASKPQDDIFKVNKKSIENAYDIFNSFYINKSDRTVVNKNEFMYRSLGLVSFYNEIYVYGRDLFPEKIQSEIPDYVDLSDYQLVKYDEAREIERELESRSSRTSDVDKDVDNVFKVYSRQRLLFTFPPGIDRPRKSDIRGEIRGFGKKLSEEEERKINKHIDNVYDERTRQAIGALTREHLTVNDSKFNLSILSPKYAEMLKNIKNTPGLVFGYSQFRSAEGIEIFARVLEENGYEVLEFISLSVGEGKFGEKRELIIKPSESENHMFSIGNMVRYETEKDTWKSFQVVEVLDEGQNLLLDGIEGHVAAEKCYRCRFAIWSGEESIEQRKLIMKQYKSKSNMYGQDLLILLTTSSGSEGINLKYVRQVHIMEPYWNKVRVEQVIGRARRIESHTDLPSDQRNVHIYMYVSKFSQQQLDGTWGSGSENLGLNLNEMGRQYMIKEITNRIVRADNKETSDETLKKITDAKYEIILQFLNLIKQSAVDCEYNREKNVASDPELANIKCLQRVEGTNIYAYNVQEEPKPVEEGFLERQVMRSIYILPYLSTKGQKLNLIYEDEPNRDLRELKGVVPIFNFYTYYGINPISNRQPQTKELIGSINRDDDTGNLKLVLHQSFVNLFDIFEKVEDIITEVDEEIPEFSDEAKRYEFVRHVVNNPKYKELLETKEPYEIEEEEEHAPRKKKIRVNIRK